MASRFDIGIWYWLVGADTNPWSSAAAATVSSSDGTYLAWLALSGGNAPTRIDAWGSLYMVFVEAGQAPNAAALAAAHVADLSGVQNFHAKMEAGLPVTSAGTPAINDTYAIDPSVQGNYAMFTQSGGSSFVIPNVSGSGAHTFSMTNLTDLIAAVSTYTQALSAAAGPNTGWPSTPVALAH